MEDIIRLRAKYIHVLLGISMNMPTREKKKRKKKTTRMEIMSRATDKVNN